MQLENTNTENTSIYTRFIYKNKNRTAGNGYAQSTGDRNGKAKTNRYYEFQERKLLDVLNFPKNKITTSTISSREICKWIFKSLCVLCVENIFTDCRESQIWRTDKTVPKKTPQAMRLTREGGERKSNNLFLKTCFSVVQYSGRWMIPRNGCKPIFQLTVKRLVLYLTEISVDHATEPDNRSNARCVL